MPRNDADGPRSCPSRPSSIVAVVTQAPILATLGMSLVRWIIVRPDLGITFIGLDNYA